MRRPWRWLLLGVLPLWVPSGVSARPAWHDAFAAHYAPGVMERVAEVRGLNLVRCMAASPWHEVGDWVEVESFVVDEVNLCRITDVSAPEDIERHRRNRLIELDFESARRLCDISRVNERSPRACPVRWRDYDPPPEAANR